MIQTRSRLTTHLWPVTVVASGLFAAGLLAFGDVDEQKTKPRWIIGCPLPTFKPSLKTGIGCHGTAPKAGLEYRVTIIDSAGQRRSASGATVALVSESPEWTGDINVPRGAAHWAPGPATFQIESGGEVVASSFFDFQPYLD